MKRYNVIIILHHADKEILMCKRIKDPYKGLLNLPGGQIEAHETRLESAYRELLEETGITTQDIKLHHVMGLTYYLSDCELEVFAGRLNKEVRPVKEIHDLTWVDLSRNFFDPTIFAGEGNIGHMIEQVKLHLSDKLSLI